jgi:hypothetical protein
MTDVLDERMMEAAKRQHADVLDTEDRCLERDLTTVLNSADIFWSGVSESDRNALLDEVRAFERALKAFGVHSVPRLRDSVGLALREGANQPVTLKLDEEQFELLEGAVRDTLLALTSWSPGTPPGWVFAAARGGSEATVEDAAENLCMAFVSRDELADERRSRTHEVLHMLAPLLSSERLETLAECIWHAESGETFDPALRPGFTESGRVGVIPIWPDPEKGRQLWVIAADASWVIASSCHEVSQDDSHRVVSQMALRWERAEFPEHGAALTTVLVEVAIESAARRTQALGRHAEAVFSLDDEDAIRGALNRLGQDLAELNAGLDELEVAAAGSRTDLERKHALIATGPGSAGHLYRLLHTSLTEALAKLDRQQQRLQGSFLAAREHAASHHVASTINELRRQQENISKNQRATDDLNKTVGRLTIMLLGPTIVFGALSVNEFWIRGRDLTASIALLLAYVVLGFLVSVLIRNQSDLVGRLFTPRTSAADTPGKSRRAPDSPGAIPAQAGVPALPPAASASSVLLSSAEDGDDSSLLPAASVEPPPRPAST